MKNCQIEESDIIKTSHVVWFVKNIDGNMMELKIIERLSDAADYIGRIAHFNYNEMQDYVNTVSSAYLIKNKLKEFNKLYEKLNN